MMLNLQTLKSWQFSEPSFRIRACFILAVLLHLLGLISIPFQHKDIEHPATLDLLLIPLNDKISSNHDLTAKNDNSDQKAKILNTPNLAKNSYSSNPFKIESNKTCQTTKLRKRTVSITNFEPQDENYLSRWQSYIEEVGNQNYPSEANQLKIRGSLRLLVAINKDGSLHDVSLRQSSGYKLLDEAAIKIVQLAAPFDPLPNEITKDVDVLEIMRTWQFQGSFSEKS